MKNFTARTNPGQMSHLVGKPLGTITNVDHHALIVPPGGTWNTEATSSGDPLRTLTAAEAWALVTQIDMSYAGRSSGRVRSVLEQLATVTAGGGQNTALVEPPFQIKAAGSTYDPGDYKRIRSIDEPMWTQTGTTEAAVITPEAFIAAYYSGSHVLRSVLEQIPTLTATDRHALIEGPQIAIDDCHFRMFEPHEIGLGMAFPDNYIVTGNKRERVRQYGGAVTPPVEDAIMGRCIASLDMEKAA
jgi:DNA (cytosine-5)-methyltransferase 1